MTTIRKEDKRERRRAIIMFWINKKVHNKTALVIHIRRQTRILESKWYGQELNLYK